MCAADADVNASLLPEAASCVSSLVQDPPRFRSDRDFSTDRLQPSNLSKFPCLPRPHRG